MPSLSLSPLNARYRAGPAGWRPQALQGNMALWLDARGPFDLDAGKVSMWRDKSGAAHHALQANAALRPVVAPAALNGHQAMSFTQGHMDIPNLGLGPEFSTFWVARPATMGTGVSFPRYMFVDGSGFNSAGRKPMYHGRASNPDGASILATTVGLTHTITDGAPFMGTVSCSSTHFESAVDGADLTTLGLPAPADVSSDQGMIGAPDTACDWAELIVLNTVADAQTIAQIEGYLAHRWGLAAQLPVAHPYRSAAP